MFTHIHALFNISHNLCSCNIFQDPLLSSRSSRHSHEASLSHTHHHHHFQKNQRQLYQPSSWLDHLYHHHPYFLHHHHHKHHQHRHQHQLPHHTLRLHASRKGNRCLRCVRFAWLNTILMLTMPTKTEVGWAVHGAHQASISHGNCCGKFQWGCEAS